MARRGEAETLAVDVYRQLRADILGGRLPPGSRIKPAEIRDQFGVSVGVVREALTRLAEQHLVRSELNKGFQVVPISPEDLRELMDARIVNECSALRYAIERGDVDWESRVMAMNHKLARTPANIGADAADSNEAFSEAHANFHMTLLSGCQNVYLLEVCRNLFDAAEFYRRWSLANGRSRAAKGEHAAIMDAALARRTEEAVTLYTRHIERTADVVLHSIAGDANPGGRPAQSVARS